MKVTFRLARAKSEEPTALYLDIRHKGKRKNYSTGISVYPDLWDHEKQRVSPNRYYFNKYEKVIPGLSTRIDNLNTEIEDVLRAVNNYIRESNVKRATISRKGLTNYLDDVIKDMSGVDVEAETPFLTDYMDKHYIPKLKSGEITYTKNNRRYKYADSTVKVKENILSALQEYEKQNGRIRFDEIDQAFYEDFVNHHEKNNLSTNYIGKLIKEVKVILRHAYEAGIHSNKIFDSRKFVTLREETTAVYLSESELDKIQALELEGVEAFYRDMFLVGCYTAMRFSDYSRIDPEHIKEGDHGKYIDMITRKTGERVFVPIHPKISSILDNPDYFKDRNVYEQKMNSIIKDLAKDAKIKTPVEVDKMKGGRRVTVNKPKHELITTHTARRTGATLMYLAKIPSIDIMKITGHKTEKAFLKYIRVTKEETAQRLALHPYFNNHLKKVE